MPKFVTRPVNSRYVEIFDQYLNEVVDRKHAMYFPEWADLLVEALNLYNEVAAEPEDDERGTDLLDFLTGKPGEEIREQIRLLKGVRDHGRPETVSVTVIPEVE